MGERFQGAVGALFQLKANIVGSAMNGFGGGGFVQIPSVIIVHVSLRQETGKDGP